MDESAIKRIQESAHIPECLKDMNDAIANLELPHMVIPKGFELKNIESLFPHLARYRMHYKTDSINDFLEYCKENNQAGSLCFVDQSEMVAKGYFDVGNQDKPLHRNHTARLTLQKTTMHIKAHNMHESVYGQRDIANMVEDYTAFITVIGESGKPMNNQLAANTFRKLTIETARKMKTSVSDYGEEQGLLESVEAKADQERPAYVILRARPYLHFDEREFKFRVSLLTSSDTPRIKLNGVMFEEQQEDIAEEFKRMLKDGLTKKFKTYFGSID